MGTTRASISCLVAIQRLQDMMFPVVAPVVMTEMGNCRVLVIEAFGICFQKWHPIGDRTVTRLVGLVWISKIVLIPCCAHFCEASRQVSLVECFAVQHQGILLIPDLAFDGIYHPFWAEIPFIVRNYIRSGVAWFLTFFGGGISGLLIKCTLGSLKCKDVSCNTTWYGEGCDTNRCVEVSFLQRCHGVLCDADWVQNGLEGRSLSLIERSSWIDFCWALSKVCYR